MKDTVLELDGGRQLAFADIGEDAWPCVLFFHGAPSSRLRLSYLESEFLARKIRVVSPDRPGYGGSTVQPGRSMNDWAADVTRLADSLGLDRFVVAGHSSGGPYALACAALIPARIVGAIVLGGVTDMRWAGAWGGYLESEARLMRLPTETAVIQACEALYGRNGAGFMSASGFELSEPDERLYADAGVARLLSVARAEAFRQGVVGYAQDVFVQGRPWPFDPKQIGSPVLVAHGEFDSMLPIAHSRHSVDVIRGSVLRMLPGHGHLSMLAELPALSAELFARSLQ